MMEYIQVLKEEFAKTVPGEEELINAFEKYLLSSVEDLKTSDKPFVKKDDTSIQSALAYLTESILNESIEVKKEVLLTDECMDAIRKNSYEAFQLAKKKMNGEKVVIDFDVEQKKNELKTWLKKVQDYNQINAKSLVSEGLLDWNYVSNSDVEIMSMRLGKQMKKKHTNNQ